MASLRRREHNALMDACQAKEDQSRTLKELEEEQASYRSLHEKYGAVEGMYRWEQRRNANLQRDYDDALQRLKAAQREARERKVELDWHKHRLAAASDTKREPGGEGGAGAEGARERRGSRRGRERELLLDDFEEEELVEEEPGWSLPERRPPWPALPPRRARGSSPKRPRVLIDPQLQPQPRTSANTASSSTPFVSLAAPSSSNPLGGSRNGSRL